MKKIIYPTIIFLLLLIPGLMPATHCNAQSDNDRLVDYFFCISSNKFSEGKSEIKLNDILLSAKRIGFYLLNTEYYSTDHGIMCQIGKINFVLQEYDSAEIWYNKAYTMDSSRIAYINNMGTINFKRGKHEKAMHFFKKAYEIDTTDLSFINNIASTYGESKDYESAYKWHKKALELGYDDINLSETYESLVITCHMLNRNEEADFYSNKLKSFKKVRSKVLKKSPVLCPEPTSSLKQYDLD